MAALRFVDCFSGAGGLSLGLIGAGFDPVRAFDSEPAAVQTYAENIGPHVIEADARELDGREFLKGTRLTRGQVDLVAGGPPCQGFSVQRRDGSSDPRNNLTIEFSRLIRQIHPRAFLMENVGALAGERGQGLLDRFTEAVEETGYRVTVGILDAVDFGVAQQRRRLFVVGLRDDQVGDFEFPAPTSDPDRPATVRDAIGDLPCPFDEPDASQAIPNHDPDRISDLNRRRISFVPPGGGREDIPEELRLPCHRVSVAKAGHRGVYGRLSWDAPAGTITTKCNSFTRGRFAHPEKNRNITMREAARLQGFPDDFVFAGAKVPVAHQIGNAVPPPLARAVGGALRRVLDGNR